MSGSGEHKAVPPDLRKCGPHRLNELAHQRLMRGVRQLWDLDRSYWTEQEIARHIPLPWPTYWDYARAKKNIPEWVSLRVEELVGEHCRSSSRVRTG